MNKELCKLMLWLNINKLSLNIGKRHFMIFRSNKRNCHFNIDLKINSQIITRVEPKKCLGVIIDKYLTWGEHVNTVKNKQYRERLVSINTLTSLYYAFIYPFLMYCVEVWGGGPVILQRCVN